MCRFSKPWAESFRAGEVSLETINNYVEYWRQHDTGNSLEEFLGLTKDEFVAFVTGSIESLLNAMGVQLAPPEIPVCKMCGSKLGFIVGDRVFCKSDYIEDNDYCFECQIDHCVHTNCLSCTIGTYPDCRFLDMKKGYMEDMRAEEAGEIGEV